MYSFFRPLLFKLDPETAHNLTLQLIRLTAFQPLNLLIRAVYASSGKPVDVFGLRFPNPVGLAAGYDKDGLAWRGLAALGFGHIEVGTVTPLPQSGNPKPRVFRLVQDRAVINRMGFPGLGAEIVAGRLRGSAGSRTRFPLDGNHPESIKGPPRRERQVILGVNLGKSKDTPLENAASDYISLMHHFAPLADYLAINISSPNTVGLRHLQDRAMLELLLGTIAKEREDVSAGSQRYTPILVKLAPDLSESQLDDALDVILRTGMDGVIATNTTLGRAGLRSNHQTETGGLSGDPLRIRSEAVLHSVVRKLNGRLPVVSVGGIMAPDDAKARLDAGAALVQVYTGLVYAGPGLVKQIIQKI
jgi:dihydroorotate dehydrogenase